MLETQLAQGLGRKITVFVVALDHTRERFATENVVKFFLKKSMQRSLAGNFLHHVAHRD
jgi:hypothetical protein